MSRPPLDPTQFPIKWIPELLSALIKRPEREAGYRSPSNVEIKKERSYPFPAAQGCLDLLYNQQYLTGMGNNAYSWNLSDN